MKTRYAHTFLPLVVALAGAFVLALATPAAARDGRDDREGRADRDSRNERNERGDRNDRNGRNDNADRSDRSDRNDRRSPGAERGRQEPPRTVVLSRGNDRRLDHHHGHNRYYPQPGWVVRSMPSHAHRVVWRGTPHFFWDGVWYRGGPQGHVVVRAPIGVRVHALPAFYTVLTLAGLTYLYANGEYYREHAQGGYEVVEAPPAAQVLPEEKLYVYPRNGQSAQQQAGDEYECHRWAAQQTGFDPAATATGQAGAGQPQARAEYGRARIACLDARGYSAR